MFISGVVDVVDVLAGARIDQLAQTGQTRRVVTAPQRTLCGTGQQRPENSLVTTPIAGAGRRIDLESTHGPQVCVRRTQVDTRRIVRQRHVVFVVSVKYEPADAQHKVSLAPVRAAMTPTGTGPVYRCVEHLFSGTGLTAKTCLAMTSPGTGTTPTGAETKPVVTSDASGRTTITAIRVSTVAKGCPCVAFVAGGFRERGVASMPLSWTCLKRRVAGRLLQRHAPLIFRARSRRDIILVKRGRCTGAGDV